MDVLRVGVLPTPAVAYLTGALGADLGVMLSASHNAMPDNGIKFFARGGHKLADELEDRIETVYEEHRTGAPWDRPTGAGVGRVRDYDEGFDQYVAHLIGVLPNRLDGLKIVLDEAHGAAARVSPEAFARAGAEVVTIGAEPDGLNINDGCGSTHLGPAARPPSSSTAPTSASRTTATPTAASPWTHAGEEVDGDQILAVLALAMRERRAAAQGHRGRAPSCPTSASSWPWSARASSSSRPRSATATSWRR